MGDADQAHSEGVGVGGQSDWVGCTRVIAENAGVGAGGRHVERTMGQCGAAWVGWRDALKGGINVLKVLKGSADELDGVNEGGDGSFVREIA